MSIITAMLVRFISGKIMNVITVNITNDIQHLYMLLMSNAQSSNIILVTPAMADDDCSPLMCYKGLKN